MKPIRVMIVEDDPFTRISLVGSVSNQTITVVASAATAKEAVTLFESISVDAILVDLDLGLGPTGVDLARLLRTRQSNLGVVMLTSYPDPRLMRSNLPDLPYGSEYLVKTSITEIETVTTAIKKSINNAANVEGATPLGSPGSATVSRLGLTDVQIETLRLVAEGHSNAEIAKVRVVSEKTVEQTIGKIAKALNIPQATNHNQRVHIARVYFRLTGRGNL